MEVEGVYLAQGAHVVLQPKKYLMAQQRPRVVVYREGGGKPTPWEWPPEYQEQQEATTGCHRVQPLRVNKWIPLRVWAKYPAMPS